MQLWQFFSPARSGGVFLCNLYNEAHFLRKASLVKNVFVEQAFELL